MASSRWSHFFQRWDRIGIAVLLLLSSSTCCIADEAPIVSRTVLQQDGKAYDNFNIIFQPLNASEKTLSTFVSSQDETIVTNLQIVTQDSLGGSQNITLHAEMNGQVGRSEFDLNILTDGELPQYNIRVAVDVLGIFFTVNSIPVATGLESTGVALANFEESLQSQVVLQGTAYIGGYNFIDFSNAKVSIVDENESGLLEPNDIVIQGDGIYIFPKPYRVGRVLLFIGHPNILFEDQEFVSIVPFAVGSDPFPNPVVVSSVLSVDGSTDGSQLHQTDMRVIDSTVQEGKVILQMFNLVDRPDTTDFVAVRGVVGNESLFNMDMSASDLDGSVQQVVLIRANEFVERGEYAVDIEVEYADGIVLPAVVESGAALIFEVLANDLIGDEPDFSGDIAQAWPLVSGILALVLFAIAFGAFVMWRRSVAADKKISALYAETATTSDSESRIFGSRHRSSTTSGSQAFGVPVPMPLVQDGILRDSYARHDNAALVVNGNEDNIDDSVFTTSAKSDKQDELHLSNLFEGKLWCHGNKFDVGDGEDSFADDQTSSWFHRAQNSGGLSDYPSSNFTLE